MRILVIIKGGSSSVDGDVPQKNEEEFVKYLDESKSDYIILNDSLAGKTIVPKSAVGYMKRKR